MTPSGTRTRAMSSPFGRCQRAMTLPTGSSSAAISSRLLAIASMRGRRERQAVDERGRLAIGLGARDIVGVGGKDRRCVRRRNAAAAAMQGRILGGARRHAKAAVPPVRHGRSAPSGRPSTGLAAGVRLARSVPASIVAPIHFPSDPDVRPWPPTGLALSPDWRRRSKGHWWPSISCWSGDYR